MKKPESKRSDCSIIIPVYNEEKTISDLLEYLQGFSCEILVVDGNPQQNTINSISEKTIIKIAGPKGRGIQLNMGARKAQGDILWFLHADTLPSPNALAHIKQIMRDQSIGSGAFYLRIDSEKVRYRLLEHGINLRSRVTRIPYGDQGIFMRKSFFEFIGGFPDVPIMEDVALMRLVKRKGGRMCLLKEPITTSARRWEHEGFLRCTLRNWWIRTLYYLGVHPTTLVKWYRDSGNHEKQ